MRIKYPCLFIFMLFLYASLPCLAQQSSKLQPITDAIGKQLTADLKEDGLNGSISVAILKKDHVLWAGAYGYADMDAKIPADTNTIYRVGSITKSFTATLLLMMVEDGKMKLDDPVENYVSEVKNINGYNGYDKITLKELASHTSGLQREPDMRNASVGALNEWENRLLACLPHTYYNSAPAVQYLYSNIGFAILGLAIERAAGLPYMTLVQQRILNPLHMNDTFFALPGDKRSRLAQGLDNSGRRLNTRLPLEELNGRGYRVPNGGLFSTPYDLSKFVMSLLGQPPLLAEKSRQLMQQAPAGGKTYGLGLMLSARAPEVIGHNGSVAGYTSQYLIDQHTGYGVILMRNYNKGVTDLQVAAINILKLLKSTD